MSYGLLDLGLSLRFNMKNNNSVGFRFNVNNVLDETYISDMRTNINVSSSTKATYRGIDVANQAFFGFGRTWNASISYKF